MRDNEREIVLMAAVSVVLIAALVVGFLIIWRPLADFIVAVLPAIAASGGLFLAAASGSLAAVGATAPLLAPVTTGIVAVGGSAAAILLLRRVAARPKDRYTALAPVIATASGVITDLGLDVAAVEDVPSTLFGALTATLLTGGGIVIRWRRAWRALGVAMMITPVVLFAAIVVTYPATALAAGLASIPAVTWIVGVLLVAAFALVGWLALHSEESDDARRSAAAGG